MLASCRSRSAAPGGARTGYSCARPASILDPVARSRNISWVEQEFQIDEPASAPLPQGTQAIDRAAQLLVRVLQSERPLGLTELADATGLPKSTTSRVLGALERRGLVHQAEPRGPLAPG